MTQISLLFFVRVSFYFRLCFFEMPLFLFCFFFPFFFLDFFINAFALSFLSAVVVCDD